MKVVGIDNYARDAVADILIAENLSQEEAEAKAEEYNKRGTMAQYYAVVKPDDYVIWNGMGEYI